MILLYCFVEDNNHNWKISTDGRDIRRKMETLSLLAIIMAITLKHSTLDVDILSMVKTSASETAKNYRCCVTDYYVYWMCFVIRMRVHLVVYCIFTFQNI
ncbi:AHL_G0017810.mRNA.1.CDS.1 [Saccharomyces cerevisiae]|nr:AHL_G0017810.mRNA.1.CDS.1 [Saccharomyces cerevisiae]CAI6651936.1 AHL_G0017810.mRNA.1.CDS.1 [Saccharomyces cerevisiae]